jgi:murein DD-endopeptidase MepM/ murein hydrolase activator NlpD
MRARMTAAFALGFALGALCLGVGLWASGALVTIQPPWKKTVVPAATNLPAPATGDLGALMADIGKHSPPPPTLPDAEPFDFSSPAPGGTAPISAPPPVIGPAKPAPSGPRPPASHGEADRIAPDRAVLPHLAMPLSGIDPNRLADNFSDARKGGKHEALDILAPRGTPVMAVAQGNVAKLFTSQPGGLTVYQFDDSRTWCYYYAHLDHYAPGIHEGTLLRAGQVLGYVGSTGNASPSSPHLHFAVFKLGPDKKWWEGTAIDPLPLLK